jgi:hypothetical protein
MSNRTSSLSKLVQEACGSYTLYLSYSGVLDLHDAKLSLLKWPDVAISAIQLLENKGVDVRGLIQEDLNILIFYPVKIIFEALRTRLTQFGIKFEDNPLPQLQTISVRDPITAKKLLVVEIDKMLAQLGSLTGVQYPAVPKGA